MTNSEFTEPTRPRQSPRIVTEAEVIMRRAGLPNFRVQIDNISIEGCRITYVDRPNLDERVWVKLDGLAALEGYVLWVKDGFAGIRFDQAIHPAVFEDLIQRLR